MRVRKNVIAADSFLLIKFFSKEEGWKEARKVIEEGVVSLYLAVKEVANSLWKKFSEGRLQRVMQ